MITSPVNPGIKRVIRLRDKAKKINVLALESGYVNKIDSLRLSKLVFDLGAGRKKKKDKIDYAVGVVLNKTLGDKVEKGDILGTIYYNKKVNDMKESLLNCYQIDKKKQKIKKIIIKTIK